MARGKWRIGIVLEAQLDTLRHSVTGEIGHHSQAKIDTGCNTARRNQVTVFHDSLFFVCRADQRKAPVHTEVTYFASLACRCTNAIVSLSPIASVHFRASPRVPGVRNLPL
jgi:hypothetical protein